jgi:hypothetical protein
MTTQELKALNYHDTEIIDILIRAKEGKEEPHDRQYVFAYVVDEMLMVGNGSVAIDTELQSHFNKEWGEAQDAILDDDDEFDDPDFGDDYWDAGDDDDDDEDGISIDPDLMEEFLTNYHAKEDDEE